ncbi:baseplate J/gp47 family protein [Acinetobacter baumannii]|uniref:baseplate J/gp47 family protein n=1 Tax=Acinetobacter TaxID=469 RepID=UPI001D5AB877|nr:MULTISPECIES: baseplate J/gp47 family protein [Acinetobacter]EHU1429312.1 baseplate J/gp47 family protein [Acinetobacter baumannii]EHU2510195.1 baseplate J/gp47 family protein [Acinetobacter baumannii]EJB8577436.1 baseplate J/gp47 family protein [Acinetobacter baumannii]MCG5907042.1 baseplate J/gp47 family protein [Acinetobacter baumannii]MCU4362578.1 baseplate J/gp47 family protein [Acinetobacter sp. WU_MDCI_Abxc22]
MSVDFNLLPKPNFVDEVDYEQILAERKEYLISLFPEEEQAAVRIQLSRESDPLHKYLQENAYREMILRNRTNQKALATLLAFAKGSDLDVWGANFDVSRLIISPANNAVVPPTPAVYEGDEDFRYRIQKKLDALSTAGPESSYEYHTLSADGRVADVKCSSPAPAHALLTILQRDTENNASTEELNNIVKNYVSAEKKRPTGDRVIVQSAEIIEYQIEAVLVTKNVPETDSVLAAAQTNAYAYSKEPKRIGKGVFFSDLYSILKVSGVERVELINPTVEIHLTNFQAASCTAIKLSVRNE